MRSIETAVKAEPKPGRLPERFYNSAPQEFVGVLPSGQYVYIGVKSREEFDRIVAPCQDSGEGENGHVLVKTVCQSFGEAEVTVIFQHWIKSLGWEGHRARRLIEERRKLLALGGNFKDSNGRDRVEQIERELFTLRAADLIEPAPEGR